MNLVNQIINLSLFLDGVLFFEIYLLPFSSSFSSSTIASMLLKCLSSIFELSFMELFSFPSSSSSSLLFSLSSEILS